MSCNKNITFFEKLDLIIIVYSDHSEKVDVPANICLSKIMRMPIKLKPYIIQYANCCTLGIMEICDGRNL